MAKQQVRVCDYDGCDTHKGVTTWVILNGAQPRRADLCPEHGVPYEELWRAMPVPVQRRYGRRAEVVTMEEVIASRRHASRRAQDQS